MKKSFLIIIFLYSFLHANYIDSDLDGVEDAKDKCQNTPFNELVDTNGCSIKKLDYDISGFYIYSGITYMNSDYKTLSKTSTVYATLDINYFYNDYFLNISSSYFYSHSNQYNDKGMFDTYLSGGYKYHFNKNTTLYSSIGIILPTYANSQNKTDYFLSLSTDYIYENFDIFAGYTYTFINDEDYISNDLQIIYQNTNSFNLGGGYFYNKTYFNISYNFTNSLYKDIQNIKSLSLGANYAYKKDIFINFLYSLGLSQSASDNIISFKIGWLF